MVASSLLDTGRADASAVRLELPPSADGARVARLVAVDAAARAGFGYDDSDDLRLAVDELFHAASALTDQSVSLSFATSPGAVTVRGSTSPSAVRVPGLPARPQLSWLAHQIVDAVADGYSFEQSGPSVRFEVQKRGGPA